MLREPKRQETTGSRGVLAGCALVLGTLGLIGNSTLAEESTILDTAEPMLAAQAMFLPITESETRVKVYTDARGRVVREVDVHLVIVDEAPAYDPELASSGTDKPSVAVVAQQALGGAFKAAAQGLAETFGEHDSLLADPSDLSEIDDILSAMTKSGLVPWSDDDGFSLREGDATAVPEPGTAVLLAFGLSTVALRRRRDAAASRMRPEPNRVDTAE